MKSPKHRPWTDGHYPNTCRHQGPNPGLSGDQRWFYPCAIQALSIVLALYLTAIENHLIKHSIVKNVYKMLKPEAHGPQCAPESLIQHFRLSFVMATNQNEEFVQLLYAWWRTTQQTFKKGSVKIPAVR